MFRIHCSRRLAFQKRSPPPDVIVIRQSLPPSNTTATITASAEGKSSFPAAVETTSSPIEASSSLLFLLSKIPKEGTTIQQLSEQFLHSSSSSRHHQHLSHLANFSRAVECLRLHCYDVVRFVRISGQGQEKILWNESTATRDDCRLSLDAVKKMFESLAVRSRQNHKIPITTARETDSVDVFDSSNNVNHNNSENPGHDDDENAAASFVDDLILSLKRDVKQEREARLAGEERIKLLEGQLMDLLRFTAEIPRK